jgi:hypothetical protein
MAELSEYELQRLEHIKRNQEFLARLGLVPLKDAEPEPEPNDATKEEKKSPRRAKVREHIEPVRRSARVLNVKPDYTGETIDNFGELLDKYVRKEHLPVPRWICNQIHYCNRAVLALCTRRRSAG